MWGEQGEQRPPEAADVGDQHRLGMTRELDPGHLLDEFFQRADAAGQRDEGVRALEHQALAGVHVGHDDVLLRRAQRGIVGRSGSPE